MNNPNLNSWAAKLKKQNKVEKEQLLNIQKKETQKLIQSLPQNRIVHLSPCQYTAACKIAKGRYENNRLNNIYQPDLDGKRIDDLDEPWRERDLKGALGEIIALNWLHNQFPHLKTSENSIDRLKDFSPRSCRNGTDDGDLEITLPNNQNLIIDVKCTTYGRDTSIPAYKDKDKNINIIMRVSLIDTENGIGFIEGFIKANKSYHHEFWNPNATTPCWSIPQSALIKDFNYFIQTNFNQSINLH